MLSKNKSYVKAKIITAIKNNDLESFKMYIEKIEAAFDRVEIINNGANILTRITQEIKVSENNNKLLNESKNILSDFYFKILNVYYYHDSDFNKVLSILESLIENEERKRIKINLLEKKLSFLLEYEGPEFLKKEIYNEIDLTTRRIEELSSGGVNYGL
jgi:glutaredoxin-related protein